MSNSLIALIASVSAGVWIYTKIMRSSGNNNSSSITVAVISGVVIFAVAVLLLGLIPE